MFGIKKWSGLEHWQATHVSSENPTFWGSSVNHAPTANIMAPAADLTPSYHTLPPGHQHLHQQQSVGRGMDWGGSGQFGSKTVKSYCTCNMQFITNFLFTTLADRFRNHP
jgi:hypothetical protein